MTRNIIIASLTSSHFRTVAVITSLINEESKAPDTSNSNGITLVSYRWVPGFSWILDQVLQQEVDYQKYYFKADLRTDRYILIADRSFYNFLSDKDTEVENLEFAERLFNKSHIVAEVKDNTTCLDQNVFPYNSLHDNRGIDDLEIRANYSTFSNAKTDDAVIL